MRPIPLTSEVTFKVKVQGLSKIFLYFKPESLQNNEKLYTKGTLHGESTKIKYNGIGDHLKGQSSLSKLIFLLSEARIENYEIL